MDIVIDSNTYEIVESNFFNTVIKVRKNLRYDSPEQENDKTYLKALGIIKILNRKFKYSDSITTSHEFIAYIMILMNLELIGNYGQ